jgi:hypothetical protein
MEEVAVVDTTVVALVGAKVVGDTLRVPVAPVIQLHQLQM